MPYRYSLRNADENLKLRVWNKGRPIPGYDPAVWRHDQCRHSMKYSEHGNTSSKSPSEKFMFYTNALA